MLKSHTFSVQSSLLLTIQTTRIFAIATTSRRNRKPSLKVKDGKNGYKIQNLSYTHTVSILSLLEIEAKENKV